MAANWSATMLPPFSFSPEHSRLQYSLRFAANTTGTTGKIISNPKAIQRSFEWPQGVLLTFFQFRTSMKVGINSLKKRQYTDLSS